MHRWMASAAGGRISVRQRDVGCEGAQAGKVLRIVTEDKHLKEGKEAVFYLGAITSESVPSMADIDFDKLVDLFPDVGSLFPRLPPIGPGEV